jgi:hypothetical protein
MVTLRSQGAGRTSVPIAGKARLVSLSQRLHEYDGIDADSHPLSAQRRTLKTAQRTGAKRQKAVFG